MNNYWQDNRTKEKMLSDYEYWKKAEKLILERLKEYFWVEESNNTDKEWKFSKYSHDAIIGYWDLEWKLEIKFTKKRLDYIQWKENQYNYAKENKVNLLQITAGKIWFIPYSYKWIYFEKGYCNKPVYSFKPVWFYNFNDLREYLCNLK